MYWRNSFLKQIFSVFTLIIFTFTSVISPAGAQGLNLPAPGAMIQPTNAYVPVIMKGLSLDEKNPFHFQFVMDTGHSDLGGDALKAEAEKLIKYFLASLTIPEEEKWVNLSPYEKDRIIPQGLGLTEMGRDMLSEDYMLKQLTASLMYPESELGKRFWDRVYERAAEFGISNIPVDTFNKVWIIPDKAVVYEEGLNAFVVEKHLKVMLEEDYVALQKSLGITESGIAGRSSEEDQISQVTSDIVREVLIPEIEKEVNQGETFANLRQIYDAMILAIWYKRNLKDSLLGQVYANQNKTAGVDTDDPQVAQKIYDQYLEAFRSGVYNYIKEDYDPVQNDMVLRTYFSGGLQAPQKVISLTSAQIATNPALRRRVNEAMQAVKNLFVADTMVFEADSAQLTADRAQITPKESIQPTEEGGLLAEDHPVFGAEENWENIEIYHDDKITPRVEPYENGIDTGKDSEAMLTVEGWKKELESELDQRHWMSFTGELSEGERQFEVGPQFTFVVKKEKLAEKITEDTGYEFYHTISINLQWQNGEETVDLMSLQLLSGHSIWIGIFREKLRIIDLTVDENNLARAEETIDRLREYYLPRLLGSEQATLTAFDPAIHSILLAEDFEPLLDIYRQYLIQAGYNVIIAKSAEQAIELYNEDPKKFGFVVTDFSMGDGANGLQLAKTLWDAGARMPLFLHAGSRQKVDDWIRDNGSPENLIGFHVKGPRDQERQTFSAYIPDVIEKAENSGISAGGISEAMLTEKDVIDAIKRGYNVAKLIDLEVAVQETGSNTYTVNVRHSYWGADWLRRGGHIKPITSILNQYAQEKEITINVTFVDPGENAMLVNAKQAAEFGRELETIIEKYKETPDVRKTAFDLMEFSSRFNYVQGENAAVQKTLNDIMVKKSRFARDLMLSWVKSNLKNDGGYQTLVNDILQKGFESLDAFAKKSVQDGKITESTINKYVAETKRLIPQWLSPKNNTPDFIRAGILRGFLEGRDDDIIYAFKEWRMFGTAGIRNQAVNSSFGVIADLELSEFAGQEAGIEGHHAPILTGPNLINTVNLLQQERAIVNVYHRIRIETNKGAEKEGLDPRFVEDVKNNKVSIAYDSRLNGKFFAHMLAAAFLQDGVNVDLFDRPAGVPAVIFQASEDPKTRSAFAILISASHSEANYNGIKVFMASQRSQVDVAGKNVVVGERGPIIGDATTEVIPYEMFNEMAEENMADFDKIFAQRSTGDVRLKWFGKEEFNPDTQRMGADFDGDFYSRYDKHVEELSLVEALELNEEEKQAFSKAQEELEIFYSAFSGVGAVNAADSPKSLKDAGFKNVIVNEKQTLVHDGRFAAFNKPGGKFGMPDPGVVQGWLINFAEFLVQHVGENFDLEGLQIAIGLLNSRKISFATDPDGDRKGAVLALPGYKGGNIKEPLLKLVEEQMQELRISKLHQKKVLDLLEKKLNDQLLLTANEAWSFLAFHELRMMHERGKLRKDRLYIIEKSHVTTDGLLRIAEYFRKLGYHIYVVDTYVGFTELAKKSRDLYKIARMSWFIHQHLVQYQSDLSPDRKETMVHLLEDFRKLNDELKRNVMFDRRGLPVIDEAIQKLQTYLDGKSAFEDVKQALSLVAHMVGLMGVEESNGYGKLGLFAPNKNFQPEADDRNWEADAVGEMQKEHISEKDGSLAALEFAKTLALGKVLESKTPIEMYLGMIKVIGAVGTDNRFLQYRGLTGEEKKRAAMRWLEQVFAVTVKKAIDNGQDVTMFNGRYKVKDVKIFRDGKYDAFWIGFPEEGVRLILEDKDGNEMYSTFRPSGTGASNRSYNWVFGARSYQGKQVADMTYEEVNEYRNAIAALLERLALDFFGVQDVQDGYAALPKEDFYGFLSAMGEVNETQFGEIMAKVIDQPKIAQGLLEYEQKMQKFSHEFAVQMIKAVDSKTGRMKEESELSEELKTLFAQNRLSWKEFLEIPEIHSEKAYETFTVGSTTMYVPEVYVMGWQTSFVSYLISLITEQSGTTDEKIFFYSGDPEIAYLVGKRVPAGIADKLVIEEGNFAQMAVIKDEDPNIKIIAPANIMPAVPGPTPGEGDNLNQFPTVVDDTGKEVKDPQKPANSAMNAGQPGNDIYGGINFNEAMLDLQIKRDGNGAILPVSEQPVDVIRQNINGLTPVIMDIFFIQSIPSHLGLNGPLGEDDDSRLTFKVSWMIREDHPVLS